MGRTNERFIALDWMRGLAVAGMIVVVSPGSWAHVYAPLRHAPWHGWTPADLVFPAFLFCVGLAMGLPFLRPEPFRSPPAFWARAARRAVLLFLLGLALNSLPDLDPERLRIPGILQRIALCYLLALGVCVICAPGGRFKAGWAAACAAALLAGYWAVLTWAPTPGLGAGRLDSLGAFPAYLDRLVFSTNHMWSQGVTEGVGVTYDPEGLLSTIPATFNVLVGVLAVRLALADQKVRGRIECALGAAALIVCGLALNAVMPINKSLWTPTFALLTSGLSLAVFVLLDLASTSWGAAKAAEPLRVMGGNAILAFILSQVLGVVGSLALLPSGGSLQGWGFQMAQGWIADPNLASLACALAVLALILAILYPLDRRGWRLKL